MVSQVEPTGQERWLNQKYSSWDIIADAKMELAYKYERSLQKIYRIDWFAPIFHSLAKHQEDKHYAEYLEGIYGGFFWNQRQKLCWLAGFILQI